GESLRIEDVAFANGGESVVLLGRNCLHVWPLKGGVRPGKAVQLTGGYGLCFTHDGSRVVGTSGFDRVAAWDVKTGKLRWEQQLKPLVSPTPPGPRRPRRRGERCPRPTCPR